LIIIPRFSNCSTPRMRFFGIIKITIITHGDARHGNAAEMFRVVSGVFN
jgi:hypothetical protein